MTSFSIQAASLPVSLPVHISASIKLCEVLFCLVADQYIAPL